MFLVCVDHLLTDTDEEHPTAGSPRLRAQIGHLLSRLVPTLTQRQRTGVDDRITARGARQLGRVELRTPVAHRTVRLCHRDRTTRSEPTDPFPADTEAA